MIHIKCEELKLNINELIARLGGTMDEVSLSVAKRLLKELQHLIEPCFCFIEAPVNQQNRICDFGFTKVESLALSKTLEGYKNACLLAVTLGHEADRFLKAKSLVSPFEQFVADAVASTLIEAACDYAVTKLPFKTGRRFSPGYSDLDLSFQEPLLNHLKTFCGCNICLNSSNLMIPTKSITAVMGITE